MQLYWQKLLHFLFVIKLEHIYTQFIRNSSPRKTCKFSIILICVHLRQNCLRQCFERSLCNGSHWMWQHADAFSRFNQNDWERARCCGSIDDARFQGLCFGSQFNCNWRTNRHEPMVYHWRGCHHRLPTKWVHYVSTQLARKFKKVQAK